MRGLTGLLSQYHDRPLRETSNLVLQDAQAFAGGPEMEDDATLFLMRIR